MTRIVAVSSLALCLILVLGLFGCPKGERRGAVGPAGKPGAAKTAQVPSAPPAGIEIVFDPDCAWLEPKANAEMASALTRFETIDAVYGHNDPSAHGAYMAAKQEGKGREKTIRFIGIDANPTEGIQYVKQGILQATFDYPTGGAEAIDLALKILHGQKVPQNIILGTRLYTTENVAVGGKEITPDVAEGWSSFKDALGDGVPAAKPCVIGMSQCNLGEPWRVRMNDDITRAANKHPELKIEFKDAQNKVETQQAQVREFVDRKVDLIIISPKEARPLTKPVAEAMDADIPVIVLDRKIEGEKYTCFIGGDNVKIGREAGKYLYSLLKGKGKIVELRGLMTSTPAGERHDGFMMGLQEAADEAAKKAPEKASGGKE